MEEEEHKSFFRSHKILTFLPLVALAGLMVVAVVISVFLKESKMLLASKK